MSDHSGPRLRRPPRRTVFAALLILGLAPIVATAQTSDRDGDAMLARAVAAPGLRSYAVTVHFDVHLHKPIGIHSKVDGQAYFRAPSQSALVITHATGLIGGFFRGTYRLDMVPQAWPFTYHVTRVVHATAGEAPVVELHAIPRAGTAQIADVVFTLETPSLRPIGADWQYTDGSSIRLTYVNGQTGQYVLPQHATVAVNMPHQNLDADATYDAYQLNVAVPDDVFTNAR